MIRVLRRLSRAWPVLPISLLLAACASAPSLPPSTVSLRVLAFNDLHGHLADHGQSLRLADPARPGAQMALATGGAAELAGLVQALRAGSPHSVVVSVGDAIGAAPLESSLFRHEPTIEVMNQIGVDVAVLGNHEFDAGQAELHRLVQGGCAAPGGASSVLRSCALQPRHEGARFAMLGANVAAADGGAAPYAPSWVREVEGVKIGFIGAVTRSTPSIVMPSGVAGLRFDDEAEAINREARVLRARGVQALVAVVHEGGEIGTPGQPADWNDSRCPAWRGAAAELERRLDPAIALVLTAHTHQGYNCRLDGRAVMQASSYGRGLAVADLVIDRASGRIERQRTRAFNLPVPNARTDVAQLEALAASLPADLGRALREARPVAPVAGTVAAHVQAAAQVADRQVGHIAATFDRSGPADSALGRLVADAQWAATRAPERGGAQLALMNAGGLRADLSCRGTPPCAVSYGQAYTAQPFGNSLVVMSLTGAELHALLEQQQGEGQTQPRLLAPSAALSYRWQSTAPAGRRVQALRLNGVPVRDDEVLRVCVNSFLAEGGDGYTILRQGRDRVGGMPDIDALVLALQQPAALVPAREPRVRLE